MIIEEDSERPPSRDACICKKRKKGREQGDLSASSVPSDHILKRIHRCTDTHFDPFSFVVVGVVDEVKSQEAGSLERTSDQDVFRYRPIDLGATNTHTQRREREPLRGVRERMSGPSR